MSKGKKTFFASDFHLGSQGRVSSEEREKIIIRWLTSIQDEMEALYLVGDIFDYWFEYSEVIPKGYIRLLGKLAELRDTGIPIYFFTGNHDMWMFRYLQDELDIPIYRQPIIRNLYGKEFFIGHGDGLGPGDHGYKIIKSILGNCFCQWAFALLHPDLGIRLMRFFSSKSRESTLSLEDFMGLEKEWLVAFAEEHSKSQDIDYYIFGHRHIPIRYTLTNQKSIYYNLGDWLYKQTYLEVSDSGILLKSFELNSEIIELEG